jgi:hypothetical protein
MLEMIPKGHPLEGVRLKLARAQEHLEMLDGEIVSFLEREPYRIAYERNSDGTEHVFRVNVAEYAPLALSVIIGDCLQNTRSALDHLVWQLAILSGKRATPRRQTAFPICDTPGAFTSKGTKDKIADLTAQYRAQIKSLQPFNISEPTKHWLWHLNELARVDRHRILHVVGGVHHVGNFVAGERDDDGNFGPLTGKFIPSVEVSTVPFKDGAEVAKLSIHPGDSNTDVTNVEVKAEFTFKIAFGQDVGIITAYNVVDVLSNILDHIETDVVAPFEPSFGVMA